MRLSYSLVILTNCLAVGSVFAEDVITGFNYGAFWPGEKPKTYQDFKAGFEHAKTIKGARATFDSARLFTSLLHQTTTNEPSPALKAAVDTGTKVLLGIWISGTSTDAELAALDTAFEGDYGKKLADLTIGISVGNEDIYRSSDLCREKVPKGQCGMPATEQEVLGNITKVRNHIKASKYASWLQGKPIGHVDTAGAVLVDEKVDFVGMTAYPFWQGSSIQDAKRDFEFSLNDVTSKAKRDRKPGPKQRL